MGRSRPPKNGTGPPMQFVFTCSLHRVAKRFSMKPYVIVCCSYCKVPMVPLKAQPESDPAPYGYTWDI